MSAEELQETQIKCSHSFKQFLETAAEEDKNKVLRVFDGTAFQLTMMEPGAERARVMHTVVDAMRAGPTAPMYKDVSCKVGCANCCFPQAHITQDEAKLLARLVKNGDVDIDFKKLEDYASFMGTPGEWNAKRQACVFLGDDKTCQVYEDRPLACRNHYVRSNPAHCATDFPAQVLNNPWIEAVSAACATVSGDGPLPRMVLAELKKDGWVPAEVKDA